MRVLHIDNIMIRRYGATKVSTGRKLYNGLIRGNHKVIEFSDRDIANYEAPFRIRNLGLIIANRRLVETCDNFRPEFILLGHCDIISNKSLLEIKRLVPAVKIAYRNVDPLWETRNIDKIRLRMPVVDAIFVTTGGDTLKQFRTGSNMVAYIPNPADPSIEDQDNSAKNYFDRDLLFCGVGNPTDDRYGFVRDLHAALDGKLKFDSFGIHGAAAVWGKKYDDVLAGSKMGLNLNRFEGWPLYSSARISQLMGNGILTFLSSKGRLQRFFSDKHAVFFDTIDDLIIKVLEYNADDARRRETAGTGRKFYQEHFSGRRVAQFIIETTLEMNFSHDYIWRDELYR